jgi:hypothetical protein
MEKLVLEKLKSQGILEKEESDRIEKFYTTKLFSLHWEIRTILYLGVVLLSTGAGLIIYKNIDSISQWAILGALGLSCITCLMYCFTKALPYNSQEVQQQGLLFDYILLLGCLLFLSFEGYFQFSYQIFGDRYGLAASVPTLLFFFLAYRFDHKGVLSMAITSLGTWMGLTVTPTDIILGNVEFNEMATIWTGLAFGISISSIALILENRNLKKHFTFTYLNFAAHVLLVSSLAGLIMSESLLKLFFTVCIVCFAVVYIQYARKEQSFYFLLVASVYSYIAVTYLIFLGLLKIEGDGLLIAYMGFFYFIGTCGLLVYFFFNYKKFLKYDRLS